MIAYEGLNHMSFMSGIAPAFVAKDDLKADVPTDVAHKWISIDFVTFLSQVLTAQWDMIDLTSSQ